MSQYDFGVIDPAVRDGSWLADALNQWRDALYSMQGGNAAPSFITNGMLWRDVSGAPALTRYKVREGGADRELWTIDNTGKVAFAGGGMATQAEVNAGAITDKGISPATLRGFTGWVTGPFGVGAAAPAGVQSYVYHATDHSILRIHAALAAPVKWAQLSLQNASRNWFASNRDDGKFVISEATLGYCLFIDTNGYVGIGANAATPAYPLEVVTGAAIDAWITTTRGGTGGNAGFAFRNSVRFWGIHVDVNGKLVLNDFSGGGYRLTMDPGAGGGAVFGGPLYAMGDANFGLFRSGGGAAPGDGRYFQAFPNNYIWWNGADQIWRVVVNSTERFNVQNNGDIYAYRLMGGPGGAGNLKGHSTGNSICFRWDGSAFYARVDEAVEHRITATSLGNIASMTVVADAGGYAGYALAVYAGAVNGNLNPGRIYFNAGTSDPRQKFNIKPASVDALAVVRAVEMIEFNYIPENGRFKPVGFNGPQLRQHIPEMVFEAENDYLRVNNDRGIPWLFRALQQLADRVQQLEQKGA